MTVMFAKNLKKEDNFVAAQDPILDKSSNSNLKAKRLKVNHCEQLLGQDRGNLCETNREPE